MKNLLKLSGLIAALSLASCASVPGAKKGPSPYSASWVGESVTPLDQKSCAPDTSFTKLGWKDLVNEAGNCVRAKNYMQVERVANHLAKIEPESHWGAYYLSIAAEARRDMPRAFWMIDLALKKAPEDGILLYQRGRLHWAGKSHDLALKDLEESVKRNPSIADAHLLLGQVQFTKDDLGRAQSSFSKVIALDAKRAEAHFGLGEVAYKKGQFEASYNHHKKASSYDPRLAISFMRLAQIQEVHYKDLPASLEAYKDLQRRVSLNRVTGDLPMDLSEKVQSLGALIKQSVAQNSDKKVSKREPSGGKVSE